MQAWSFKDISQESIDIIENLFVCGMTAGTAYKEFISNLKLKCGNDLEYHKALADRSVCPRRNDFNMLRTEFNRKKNGGSDVQSKLKIFEKNVSLQLRKSVLKSASNSQDVLMNAH